MTKYRLKSKLYGIPTFGVKNIINGVEGVLKGTPGSSKMIAKGTAKLGVTGLAGYGALKTAKTYKDAYTGNMGIGNESFID